MNPITRGRRLCLNINESEQLIQALDICLFNPPNRTVYKLPSERIQHPSKKHLRAGSSMTHCKKPLHSRTNSNKIIIITIKALGLRPHAFICFSVSGNPGQTLALMFDILHEKLLA